MKRKVKFAFFHDTLFIPGIGNLDNKLPSPSKTMKLDMWYDGGAVLEVNVNGVSAFVPIATVKVGVYESEAPVEARKAS